MKWLRCSSRNSLKKTNPQSGRQNRPLFCMSGSAAVATCLCLVFGTGEGHLWYGICVPCAKRLPGVRDAFSEAFGVKNRLLRYGMNIRYRNPPLSGTGNVCQHPKISGNRYCNRMGRRNVGFDEENQRSFGLLPSNFVSLQNGIEVWCNGSTTDFGSACPSSNLGTSTFLREVRHY